jgi:hypothetical protein
MLLDGIGMRAISAAFLFCLIAVQPALSASAPGPDAAALAIDAGRLMVMVDQSAEALKLLAPAAKIEDEAQEPAQTGPVFPELVYAVQRYDIVVVEACRLGVAGDGLCADLYRPIWLGGGQDAEHDGTVLRAMIDDATAHLEPFWSDICKREKHLSKDEAFCQLE